MNARPVGVGVPSKAPKKASAKPRKAAPKKAAAASKPKAKAPMGPAKGKAGKASKAGVVLLSGGNPQIAKADGDAPVQAYIAAMPEWKRDLGRRLDDLVTRTVPGVRKAVRWNSPMYGVEGQGWFLSFHVYDRFVKVTFFRGTSLKPAPPGGQSREGRWVNVHEDDLDEAQMADWIRQAASIPGWGGF